MERIGRLAKLQIAGLCWGLTRNLTAVSTRPSGHFVVYKIDAAVDVATGLPVAWNVRTAKHPEQDFSIPLVNRGKERGFGVQTAIMDKGYDVELVHSWCMERSVAPIIAMRGDGPIQARGRRTAALRTRRVDVRRSGLQAEGHQVALPQTLT
jgi:hypothetical protein